MRRNETRTPSPKLRTWRAFIAAAILLVGSIGVTQAVLSVSDDTPVYGAPITISATGITFPSTTDYTIGYMLTIGDQLASRTDLDIPVVGAIVTVTGEDTSISITDDWALDTVASATDTGDAKLQFGTHPMKLFIVSATEALPTTTTSLTDGSVIAASNQIWPGTDTGNGAGSVNFSGLGYDDAPVGLVKNLPITVTGTNWATGTGDSGAGVVVEYNDATSPVDVAFWTEYYQGNGQQLFTFDIGSGGAMSDGAGTVPNLTNGANVAVWAWFENDASTGYTLVSSTTVTPTTAPATSATSVPTPAVVRESSPVDVTVEIASTTDIAVTWQVSDSDDTSWSNVTFGGNVTSSTEASGTEWFYTLTISETEEADDGKRYRAWITAGQEEASTGPVQFGSSPVLVTVSPVSADFVFTEDSPEDVDAVAGTNAVFSVSVSPTGATFNYAYQWQESTNGGVSWTDVSRSDATGVSASTLTIASVDRTDDGNQYRVITTLTEEKSATVDKEPVSKTSDAATLTVSTAGKPTSLVAFPDDEKAWISFVAPAQSGSFDIINYEYEISGSDEGVQTLSPASTEPLIEIGDLTNGTTYSVRVRPVATGTGDAQWSDFVTFTVSEADAPVTSGAVITPTETPQASVSNGIATIRFDVKITNDGDDALENVWIDPRSLETSESIKTIDVDRGSIQKVGSVWLWRGANIAADGSGEITVTVEIEVE